MELRDYLTLWFLKYGECPFPHNEWLIEIHSNEEIKLYHWVVNMKYAERKGGWNAPSYLTPKGLEFIKNG